ncbi:MAG: UDP-galactose-lipid carrier transferase [Solirubrobacterales bacterium]|nr:UDP-galactose-lipid carrier transferase [Solirubrobacterales bacterium]
MSRLDAVDLTASLSKKESQRGLERAWTRLSQLRLALAGLTGEGRLGPPLLVMFEGWDAAGKGGAIKRLVSPLDPRHVRAHQFAAPSPEERRHHFLWRFWDDLPGWGEMAVFDRTWYGRVLVERVEGYASREEWTRAYEEIERFELSLVREGTIVVKLWLQISPAEQLRRFEARRDDPLKSWKLSDEDWRNRERRPAYERAIEEMLERTDSPHAPWELVAAESKHHARLRVVEIVIGRIERGMRDWGLEPPEPLPNED